MPIQNLSEAQARLQDTAPLAPEELRAIALFLPVLGPGPKARFEAEVAFQAIRAIEQLDRDGDVRRLVEAPQFAADSVGVKFEDAVGRDGSLSKHRGDLRNKKQENE